MIKCRFVRLSAAYAVLCLNTALRRELYGIVRLLLSLSLSPPHSSSFFLSRSHARQNGKCNRRYRERFIYARPYRESCLVADVASIRVSAYMSIFVIAALRTCKSSRSRVVLTAAAERAGESTEKRRAKVGRPHHGHGGIMSSR